MNLNGFLIEKDESINSYFGLLLILHSVWVHTFGVAIYDTKGTEVILSNLNFPVAVTREWYFTLFLLIFQSYLLIVLIVKFHLVRIGLL